MEPQPRDAAKTAVLAGNGMLPEMIATKLRQDGNDPFCVSIDGEAGGWIAGFDHIDLGSVEVGVLVRALNARGAKRVVLAGGVGARPSLWSVRFDWVTLTNLLRFYKALGKGDDRLLRCFIEMLEGQGFEVIGAHQILPDLLAPIGVLTKRRPTEADLRDRDLAMAAALETGHKDLGQAAIAAGGRLLAVEGAKGTDAMLAAAGFQNGSGVLAKAAKPQQEHRADLPSIGPKTVDSVARAGLAGIAVSAGSSLILDREEVIRRADAAGIFVEGCVLEAKR